MEKQKQPLLSIAKREALPWYKNWLIRGGAILLALVFCGIITMLLTGLNPVEVFRTLFYGAFGTNRKIWVTAQNLAILLGISLAGGGAGVGITVYHLDGDCFGANLRSLYLGYGRRKGEGAGFAGLQDVGVRSLGGTGGFSVHHLDAGGRALLRAPDQGEVLSGFPLEV